MLAERPMNKGGRPENNPSYDTRGLPIPLEDIGISHDQSSRWQRLENKSSVILVGEIQGRLIAITPLHKLLV